ncbi:acyltransferase family protein [Paremcibacter congregatus]|uniref:Acyltransferase 3 domain-containing protein n=1 Tax=Paremcibacter congregatus TaxID=2043170 RepID=A0A2G4YVA4_9PROT|nr:acyltransferase [Paremcibacter congregatus]PHZ85376.1 hypothetical protein CRD36_08255 [Paremcibacter congregatus]QDE27692.1 acyltransferase [Paremcibacter congregatus]
MFLSHIHNFRALAIIGIICTHSLDAFQWNDNPEVFRLFKSVVDGSSLLFTFISGFLFQYLSKNFEKEKYWKNKVKNVISPYFFMSIPALYYFTQIEIQDSVEASFYALPTYQQILYFLGTGRHMAPYWFVPAVTIFFILGPFLVWAEREGTIYKLMPLFIVISFFHGKGGQLGPLSHAIYMFSIYLAGMYFARHHDRLIITISKYHLILLAATILFSLGQIIYYEEYRNYFMYLHKLVICPLLIYYLYQTRELFGHTLTKIGHFSFGIFFIHAYILPLLKRIYVKFTDHIEMPEGDIISSVGLTLFVLIICVLIVSLSNKVGKKYSKLVIGS